MRETIFAEIERRLNDIAGIQLVERMPSGDPDAFPCLSIFDGNQEVVEEGSAHTRHSLTVMLEGFVEGASGANVHAALSALYADAVVALITEPPLGGLAETISEAGMRVSVAELASKRRLGFGLDIQIEFSTQRGNPAMPA
ncbi:hypothetical protein [Sphingobium agri]|uniref:DUF3168 domain-containing protein n=1 Tax=Sphingobium agri TaxID=2933566 RepID=A0ABT0DWI5_9SPHN|nr:hypothetical protein [Sphingobium agri]MCK0531453.1 hypothetical protein [Sphingobium agri]